MRRAAVGGVRSGWRAFGVLLGACCIALPEACSESPQTDDGTTDVIEEDAAEVDSVEPLSCEVVRSGEPLATLPCRNDTCFRPHLSLGGRPDQFLVAYSKNVGWWSTDVFARLVNLDGLPVGEEINVSGRTRPSLGRPPRASSEYPFALAWNAGWLITWEDLMTTHVFIAGSALDGAGETIWTGSQWTSTSTGSLFTWVGAIPVAPLDAGRSDDYVATTAVAVSSGENAVLGWTAFGNAHLPGPSVAIGLLLPSGRRRGIDQDVSSTDAVAPGWAAIASSGDTLLVAWEDRRPVDISGDGTPDPDIGIWARLIDAETLAFRSDELPIVPARYESSRPVVLWSGTHFLVAWQDFRTGYFEIFAARVTPDGTIEAPGAIRATETLGASRNPALAAAPTGEIFLTWQEASASRGDAGGSGFDVWLSRSLDGGTTWELPTIVATDAGVSPEPRVAVAGQTIGVTWIQDVPPDFEVRFARIECP